MAGVFIKEREPFEAALRRFKRLVEKSGILPEVRRRSAHMKKSTKNKRAKDAACRRSRKRMQRDRLEMESLRRISTSFVVPKHNPTGSPDRRMSHAIDDQD